MNPLFIFIYLELPDLSKSACIQNYSNPTYPSSTHYTRGLYFLTLLKKKMLVWPNVLILSSVKSQMAL